MQQGCCNMVCNIWNVCIGVFCTLTGDVRSRGENWGEGGDKRHTRCLMCNAHVPQFPIRLSGAVHDREHACLAQHGRSQNGS